MTATHVDGVAVVADEPAETGIANGAGAPVTYKRIRKLLLADERIVYGCSECDFTGPSPAHIRPHMNKHRAPDARPKRSKARLLQELTLADLLAKVRQLEELAADRDQWKSRALKAERSLSTLRAALREG